MGTAKSLHVQEKHTLTLNSYAYIDNNIFLKLNEGKRTKDYEVSLVGQRSTTQQWLFQRTRNDCVLKLIKL